MKHILFGSDANDLKVAILIKGTAMNKGKMKTYYIDPCTQLVEDNFVALDLLYDTKGKASAKVAKPYVKELLKVIDELGINTVLVCDSQYFKFMTGARKVDKYLGCAVPCTVTKYEHIHAIPCANHQAIAYNPALQDKIFRALKAAETHAMNCYVEPGKGIIQSAYYPDKVKTIGLALEQIREYPELTCDIETRGLEFWNCGISSIALAWNEHEGIAFGVERAPDTPHSSMSSPEQPIAQYRTMNETKMIKNLLKMFFITYPGKLTFHNIGFDAKVLVYDLFMSDLMDYEGMIQGISYLTKNFDDSKLIAYLATNNAVKNELGLKALSGEFTGNYAEDVTNTDAIPYDNLLEYNLTDCLATWYVKKKYWPILVEDQQEEVYQNLMKETTITLLQTELCGMPIDPQKVQEAKTQLNTIVDECNNFFDNSSVIQAFHMGELITMAEAKTAQAKKKIYTVDDPIIARNKFNPGSHDQLRRLLYDYLSYPVLDFTKSKQASTSSKTIKKLKVLAETQLRKLGYPDNILKGYEADVKRLEEHVSMFTYLRKLADASIILSTFIPAFENAQQLPDGSYRLYGNFNSAGTQSLRLSSSNPNLMNLPSGSTFSKLIKDCFRCNNDWVFGGSDFDALEDKTGALLTRDPARLKIYTDGFCGHCLRSQSYWPDRMPDINPSSVSSINSIKKLYPTERQDSKAPSFALQYGGTYLTLMKNCGFSEAEAKAIEERYHKLYEVSDAWIEGVIEQAKKDGYITMAFGARIRTPLLAKTVGNGRHVPYQVQGEARSAGNAKTQSYCALTLRAFNEFRKRLWQSPYRLLVLPSATIHDAIYLVWRNSLQVTKWVNDTLIECMAWQELEELKHPTIKISSSLEIFWPSWARGIEFPNEASEEEIRAICMDAQDETFNKK